MVLENISFVDITNRMTVARLASPLVVLCSLKLLFIEEAVSEAVLSSFTVVDISGSKYSTKVRALVGFHFLPSYYDANMRSSGRSFEESTLMNDLRSIHLDVYRASSIAVVLAKLGWLPYLGDLKFPHIDAALAIRPTPPFGRTWMPPWLQWD